MCGVSRGIVSQGHDKVFTLKMARKCLFRARFAFYQLSWHDYSILNNLAGWNLHLIGKYNSLDLCSGAHFYLVPEYGISYRGRLIDGGGFSGDVRLLTFLQ